MSIATDKEVVRVQWAEIEHLRARLHLVRAWMFQERESIGGCPCCREPHECAVGCELSIAVTGIGDGRVGPRLA